MLKELDLRANMPKDEYAPLAEALKPRLAWLQQEAIRENIPVIILFEMCIRDRVCTEFKATLGDRMKPSIT